MTGQDWVHQMPARRSATVFGLSAAGIGGCLTMTVIGAVIGIPLGVIGLLVLLVRVAVVPLVVKTTRATCPLCARQSKVEHQVGAFVCPKCEKRLLRTGDGWEVIG